MKVARIIIFKDIYDRPIPTLVQEYDILYCQEDYVSLGLAGREFYKVPWDNLEVMK